MEPSPPSWMKSSALSTSSFPRRTVCLSSIAVTFRRAHSQFCYENRVDTCRGVSDYLSSRGEGEQPAACWSASLRVAMWVIEAEELSHTCDYKS